MYRSLSFICYDIELYDPDNPVETEASVHSISMGYEWVGNRWKWWAIGNERTNHLQQIAYLSDNQNHLNCNYVVLTCILIQLWYILPLCTPPASRVIVYWTFQAKRPNKIGQKTRYAYSQTYTHLPILQKKITDSKLTWTLP